MEYFFYITVAVGLCYFLMRKRKFDLITLAYFSAIIYFLPGFYGYINEPTLINSMVIQVNAPIIVETYVVMITVFVAILFTAIIYDSALFKLDLNLPLFKKEIRETYFIPHILVIISLLTTLFTISQMGSQIFSGKSNAWDGLGVMQTFWRVSVTLLLIISFVQKRKLLGIYSLVLLTLFFLIGSRSAIALAVLAIITYVFYEKGKKPLVNTIKIVPLILISMFGLLIFIGKRIYGSFQYNGIIGVIQTLLNKDIYMDSIINSEPFATQMILNTVLKYSFHIGTDHIKDLPLQLLFVPSYFGAESGEFSEIFKNAYYGFVNYGLAYNIWAEAFSIGKWPILILIIIIYCFILLILNLLLRIKDKTLKSLILLVGAYWAFYIHRNSIETIITFERYNVLIYGISIICSFFLYIVINKKPRLYNGTKKNMS